MIFILFINVVLGKLTHYITIASSQFDLQQDHNYEQDYSFSIYQGQQFGKKYFDIYSKQQKSNNDRIKQPEQEVKMVCDPDKIILNGKHSFDFILQQIGFINAFCLEESDQILRKYVEEQLEINEEYRQHLLKQNLTNPMIYENISLYTKYREYSSIILPKVCPNILYYFQQGLRELVNDKDFQEIVADQYFLSNFVNEKQSFHEVITLSKVIWNIYVQTTHLEQFQQEEQNKFSIDLKSVQEVSDMIYLQTFKYYLGRKEAVQIILGGFIDQIKAYYQESKMVLDIQEEITLLAFMKMMLTDEEISERRLELVPQRFSKLVLTFKSNDVLIQFNGINLRKISKCKNDTQETCTIDDFFDIINDYEIFDYELICIN